MLFNSLTFAIFLPVVFALYWFASRTRNVQNMLLLVASYVFYGWWDWRFLSLLLVSTIIDFSIGRSLQHTANEPRRRGLLILSLVVNLGILFTFKYYNFFVDSFEHVFASLGLQTDFPTLHVILPVGISFYTFQTLSYSIDVYRRKIPASDDPVAFATFVAFFPQLVAGPIERARDLLPQFGKDRCFHFEDGRQGLRQILFGLFKKVVVADQCGAIVASFFDAPGEHSGLALAIGTVLFSFQIYGDFSGYSDIAIGSARLLGFRLTTNFRYPYFARDIAEFWRRWHISLTTWFRDYLYFPLGGSRAGRLMTLRNVFIVFLVSALWHGANWTFVVWGSIHTLLYIPLLLTSKHRTRLDTVATDRHFPCFSDCLRIAATFAFVSVAWVFFRADSLSHAIEYFEQMLAFRSGWLQLDLDRPLIEAFAAIGLLVGFEWLSRTNEFALEDFLRGSMALRWCVYCALVMLVIEYSVSETPFIYFQF